MSAKSDLDRVWEAFWDRLEEGDPEGALAVVADARERGVEADELGYLEGVALAEGGALDEAASLLSEIHRDDPDWIDAGLALAWVLFRACRFEESREVFEGLGEDDELPWDAFQLRGLLEERAGRAGASDAAFRRAHELAPEGERPSLLRLDRAEFGRITEAALAALPATFRDALTNVAILVEPFPAEELLRGDEPPLDPESLGLFSGTPRSVAGVDTHGRLPDVIYLFQRNLERDAENREDLEREIAITLYHEIGHYLGFEEEDMPRLGLE